MKRFDVIVVGLGATGGATAYHLARAGVHVLGVDRYSPPHGMGSSHGDTRITRRAVGEGEAYVPFVTRSHVLWRELEEASGESLLHETGVLIMAPSGEPSAMHGSTDFMGTTTALAKRHGIEHEVVSPDVLTKRFPQFHLDRDYTAYFEPGAGYVRAEAAVGAHLDVAQRMGAAIHRSERVIGVEPARRGVVVTTDLATYAASTVVLAAGAWLPELLPPGQASQFTVYRQILVWFGTNDASLTDLPVFIWQYGTGMEEVFYGFPAVDGPDGGLKIGTENFSRASTVESARRDVSDEEISANYDRCVRGRLPGLRPSAVRSAGCVYTVTPDFGFVIDRHPEHDNVIIASPCSGHGFKHSAAVGEAVAQLAVGERPTLDLADFSISRFRS